MLSLSPSQLSVWQRCQMMWYYSYVEKLSPLGPDIKVLAKGNYLHELAHFYYGLIKAGFEIGDDMLLNAIRDRIGTDMEEYDDPDYEFFKDVTRTIIGYITKRSPVLDSGMRGSDIEVEKELSITVAPFDVPIKLHGFMDLIWNGMIRDHKTGTKPDVYKDIKKVQRLQQLIFYGLLYYRTYDQLPTGLQISWINSSPPKNPSDRTQLWLQNTTYHPEERLEGFYNYLIRVLEFMHVKRDYLHNFSECGNCPYFHLCDSELRGLDSTNIRKGMFRVKAHQTEMDPENSEGDSPSETVTPVNFG